MVRTPPDLFPKRQGQRGFALVLALFLLAIASALGLIISGNGLSARKSARAASLAAATQERAAMATWMTADRLEQPQKYSRFSLFIEGGRMETTVSPESGRIDLNGLPPGGLAEAIGDLGYDPTAAERAAGALSEWRGPKAGLPDGSRAFWSIDDLDDVAGLEPGIRNCLKLWGTAHARGPFLPASTGPLISLISEIGSPGNIAVGSMVRIIVLDQFSGMRFRSILLYTGERFATSPTGDFGLFPWLVMEWLRPAEDQRCEAKSE